jgi:predicted ATPase/DNA-binding SARP family transcriptional activator
MIQSNRTYATPILSIHLLGSFLLDYQGQALNTINTERLQSLLAYLLLHRDAPVPRQHLAFLFWPDSSEAQARTNLRNLLHKLRAALPKADRYLAIDQQTIHWQNSAPFRLDVDDFLALAGRSASIQDLKAAIQMYSGDFMRDFYEDWVHGIRENLRQTYLITLEKLMGLLAESRRFQDALQYGQILLRSEPTREETYRDLMRLYAQSGDRTGVSRIYKTCGTVLERELGVEPSPATVQAYETFSAQATNWTFSPDVLDQVAREPIHHNLPVSLTSFIGRGQELDQVSTLLTKQRFVTLSGPGRIGKTRLALATVRSLLSQYRDGIFLVDLASVDRPGMVTAAIADTLQATDQIRAAGLDGLINLLRDQNLLLVLDNCEHLTEEVGGISLALLQACPELSVLATSREVLNTYGETVWQVPALPTPTLIEHMDLQDPASETQALQANESVELFIERAAATLPTFRPTPETLLTIAEICRQLEGMPLAIELAAARVKTLTVHQIVQRLDNMLEFLKASPLTALPRHQTMAAVIDWSYGMLTVPERELFARLSVFSGDFSLQAAEHICQGEQIREGQILELLASLVDKSLVETLPSLPEARFRLHEIARQYARQKLDVHDQLLHWQGRHLDYFLRLAEEGEPKLRGTDQLEWLNCLDLEQENLRAALRLALEGNANSNTQHAELPARLVAALWLFWFIRGHFGEGRHWSERALAALESQDPTHAILGKVLYVAASFCYFQGDLSQANLLSEKSLDLCKVNRDVFGQVICCHHRGLVAAIRGESAQASEYFNQGLEWATDLEELWLMGVMRSDLGSLALISDDLDQASGQYRQALEITRQSGDKLTLLYTLSNMADIALQQGNLGQAAMLAEESLSVSRLIGERRGISFSLHLLGRIALQQKQFRRARDVLRESLQFIWSTRDRATVIEYLIDLADYEVQQERFEIAARLLAACEAALTDFPAGYRLPNQALFEKLAQNIQMLLDSGIFTAAWTLGRLMSLEQAVGFALVDRPPKPNP